MSTITKEIARRKEIRGRKKVQYVMGEFKAGGLRSSSGEKVTKPDQAIAIALSEAGMSKKKKRA